MNATNVVCSILMFSQIVSGAHFTQNLMNIIMWLAILDITPFYILKNERFRLDQTFF